MRSDELVRLLAQRNEPSVLEKEARFDQLVRRLEPRRPWSFGGLLGGGALALAAALALLVWRPALPDEGVAPELASRGSVPQAGPTVRLACVQGSQEGPCTLGSTLVFDVAEVPSRLRHFGAFARRSDGSVIWYFPQGMDRSPPLMRATGILDQAVVLRHPHAAGEYDVFVLFSELPLSQADIRASLGPELESSEGLQVVRRRLILENAP